MPRPDLEVDIAFILIDRKQRNSISLSYHKTYGKTRGASILFDEKLESVQRYF